jgi:nucleotide-binding universal stress UspA family protein
MSHVDQFESAFRSAIRPTYKPHAIRLQRALLVTDLSKEETKELKHSVQPYLQGLAPKGAPIEWDCLTKESFDSTASLLRKVETLDPDLICTYRNLNTDDWHYQNSVGSRLDTLINQSTFPVLVIPHPKANSKGRYALKRNNTVVAITDHLTDDHQLIDYSAAFLERPGKLVLVHLEDQPTFDRYLDAISRITTIDTENARQQLATQLLKAPEAFVQSCRERLNEANSGIDLMEIVKFAKGIDRFKETIHELEADLLVMKGIDHDQPGIHGLAQRLINETRQIPVLVI